MVPFVVQVETVTSLPKGAMNQHLSEISEKEIWHSFCNSFDTYSAVINVISISEK